MKQPVLLLKIKEMIIHKIYQYMYLYGSDDHNECSCFLVFGLV